ncbi:MAG TPA: hypothetical protein VFX01_04860, partial [Methylophilaceae bacterium]|nr:hypothetical protein [Methylophilaceae bacterium]
KAQELNKILDAPSINARFSAAEGAIKGIDLVRAIQASGKEKAISGSTRFDAFSGNLTLENKHYQYRELSLQASQLQARGEVDIFANQDLSGKIDIKLTLKSRQLQSRIYLSGKLAQPLLK